MRRAGRARRRALQSRSASCLHVSAAALLNLLPFLQRWARSGAESPRSLSKNESAEPWRARTCAFTRLRSAAWSGEPWLPSSSMWFSGNPEQRQNLGWRRFQRENQPGGSGPRTRPTTSTHACIRPRVSPSFGSSATKQAPRLPGPGGGGGGGGRQT